MALCNISFRKEMKNQRWKIVWTALLFLQIIIFAILTNNPEWIEYNYITYFFRNLSKALRILTSPFNFSIGLIVVYLASIALVCWIFKSIYLIQQRKLNFKQFILNILAFLSPVYLFYMLTWGLAYHKKPLVELMNLDKSKISDAEVIGLAESLVAGTNAARKVVNEDSLASLTFEKVFEQAPLGYAQLAATFPYLKYEHPSIKKAAGSTLLAYMSTSGVYMFPSGEANINSHTVLYDAPYVCTHEMAHQLGFASEAEANFLAYLACRNHPNPIFRYSANYGVVFRSLSKVWQIDSLLYKKMYKQLDAAVIQDFEKERAVWRKFQNPIQKYLVGPFYNLFLKSNGLEDGIKSYDLALELLIAERRKNRKTFNFKVKTSERRPTKEKTIF
jgi:hypothetical protein